MQLYSKNLLNKGFVLTLCEWWLKSNVTKTLSLYCYKVCMVCVKSALLPWTITCNYLIKEKCIKLVCLNTFERHMAGKTFPLFSQSVSAAADGLQRPAAI